MSEIILNGHITQLVAKVNTVKKKEKIFVSTKNQAYI